MLRIERLVVDTAFLDVCVSVVYIEVLCVFCYLYMYRQQYISINWSLEPLNNKYHNGLCDEGNGNKLQLITLSLPTFSKFIFVLCITYKIRK